MADYEQLGYLGRKQFTDLLGILQIYPDDDTLESMFLEMDENGDGQIQFDGTRAPARTPPPLCRFAERGKGDALTAFASGRPLSACAVLPRRGRSAGVLCRVHGVLCSAACRAPPLRLSSDLPAEGCGS